MLPTRPALGEDEALDCYLERLASANDLTATELTRLLTRDDCSDRPTAAFMMFKPAPQLVTRISSLTGLNPAEIERATLMRFGGGYPLSLDGLDPRDRESFRNVVAQGWFPNHGSQACPQCLESSGIWRIEWRLPIVTVCSKHWCFLVPVCPVCRKRFRARRGIPIRLNDSGREQCGNPVGLHEQCRQSVPDIVTHAAPEQVVAMVDRVEIAIGGSSVDLFSRSCTAADYLAELRNLATLLMHLACRPNAHDVARWATTVQEEAATRRTELRGPRWGFQPPTSANTRCLALAEADALLLNVDADRAVPRLLEWFSLIRGLPVGPYGWIKNRTVLTPAVQELVITALLNNRHVGRRLESHGAPAEFSTTAIPQVLSMAAYHARFRGMFGASELTARIYVSLCLARLATGARSWDDAATALGLPPTAGRRVARAASGRMRVAPAQVQESVENLAHELPADRDYRHLERRVRALSNDVYWFADWQASAKPARAANTLPYAITWMWCQEASAWLHTSPAWDGTPSQSSRSAYRAFARRLPQTFQDALARTLLEQPIEERPLRGQRDLSNATEGIEDGPVDETN